MATVQNIIDRSLRLIGNIEPGTSGTASESADAMTALNDMLGTWRNESLMCYAMQDQSITLAATNSTRSIGPTGSLVTTRPVEIESAYVTVGLINYPMEIWNAEQFSSITLRTQTNAWPWVLWYQASMPDGVINLWPVPDAASVLHVITRQPVLVFAALTDVISLPPGWENALAYNLAVNIAPEYEQEASQTVKDKARDTVKMLKRTNNVTPVMSFDASLLSQYRRMDSTGNFYP